MATTTRTEHAYPAGGAEELTLVERRCQRCGADHLHRILRRDRTIDGSPWTRDLVACCHCRDERPTMLFGSLDGARAF